MSTSDDVSKSERRRVTFFSSGVVGSFRSTLRTKEAMNGDALAPLPFVRGRFFVRQCQLTCGALLGNVLALLGWRFLGAGSGESSTK